MNVATGILKTTISVAISISCLLAWVSPSIGQTPQGTTNNGNKQLLELIKAKDISPVEKDEFETTEHFQARLRVNTGRDFDLIVKADPENNTIIGVKPLAYNADAETLTVTLRGDAEIEGMKVLDPVNEDPKGLPREKIPTLLFTKFTLAKTAPALMKEYPAKNAMGATTKVKLVGSTFSAVAILNLPATYGSVMPSKDIKMPADVARNVIKRAQWHLKIRTLLAPGQKSLVVEDGTYIKPTITDPVEVYVDGRTITAVLTHADLIDPDRSEVIASFDLPPVDISDPFVLERKGSNDVLGVGLEVTPPDIQHALGLNVTTGSGCILTSVMQGSPAERAGLQLGDVVTRIQDTQINHVPDVSSALLNISPGTERLFVVHRQGQLMVLRIKF